MGKVAKQRIREKKLQTRLRHDAGKAITDFNMIEENDRVMVCLSGGKDSYAMLEILLKLQHSAPINFELTVVHLDQKQPGYDAAVLPDYLQSQNIPYYIIERDTFSVVARVVEAGKTQCGLCSRLRRGVLYNFAEKHGFTKIALGHHRDDMIETLFLNLFHGGTIKAMPPKLRSDDGRNIVIRPLAYCRERDIAAYARIKGFPIVPCNLCGSQSKLERHNIKVMLSQWEQQYPGRIESIARAISHVSPSQLADRVLYDFVSMQTTRGRWKSTEWLEEKAR